MKEHSLDLRTALSTCGDSHTADERVPIGEIIQACQAYALLIKRLCT